MTIELIKQLMDTCYLAKRARDLLPPLPDGVTSSYIQYLDVIQRLEAKGVRARVSDLSDALNLPRPGVTRTVKEMEAQGYLQKQVSAEDVQVTYLLASEETVAREFGAYDGIRDNFPKYVVSMDELDLSRNGIKHRNIRDFLLAERWD